MDRPCQQPLARPRLAGDQQGRRSASADLACDELRGALLGSPERRATTRNVARHVLGHVLGLGHSDDPDSVMYRTRDTEDGFGQSDVAIGRCEAYRLWMLHPPVECPLPLITLCF
jgi:hypothetical protein